MLTKIVSRFIPGALSLVLLTGCGLGDISEPKVVSLQESDALEQVGTIDIQETDSLFIGAFESADVTLNPFRMYIADHEIHRVAVVDRSGTIRRLIGRQGRGPGELQDPQRAVRVGNRVVVEDDQGQLSVFSADGEFRRRDRLPKGVWRGGMWSLTEYEQDLYMAIQDTDPRAKGLRATPNQNVVAKLDSSFGIAQKFGTYPELYQNEEYMWRFTTLDISRDGLAAVGYYLVPDVQVYDVSRPGHPHIETVELDHPRFTEPEEPLPMEMSRSELQEHAIDLSFVWQTYILRDSTVVQVFNNRTKAFYDDQAEGERHHYAILGKVGSDKQRALELPGRVFARDEKERLYIELNPTPDQRMIGIYEVNWP